MDGARLEALEVNKGGQPADERRVALGAVQQQLERRPPPLRRRLVVVRRLLLLERRADDPRRAQVEAARHASATSILCASSSHARSVCPSSPDGKPSPNVGRTSRHASSTGRDVSARQSLPPPPPPPPPPAVAPAAAWACRRLADADAADDGRLTRRRRRRRAARRRERRVVRVVALGRRGRRAAVEPGKLRMLGRGARLRERPRQLLGEPMYEEGVDGDGGGEEGREIGDHLDDIVHAAVEEDDLRLRQRRVVPLTRAQLRAPPADAVAHRGGRDAERVEGEGELLTVVAQHEGVEQDLARRLRERRAVRRRPRQGAVHGGQRGLARLNQGKDTCLRVERRRGVARVGVGASWSRRQMAPLPSRAVRSAPTLTRETQRRRSGSAAAAAAGAAGAAAAAAALAAACNRRDAVAKVIEHLAMSHRPFRARGAFQMASHPYSGGV